MGYIWGCISQAAGVFSATSVGADPRIYMDACVGIGVRIQCAGVSRGSCAEIAPCSAFTACGDLTALYQLCN